MIQHKLISIYLCDWMKKKALYSIGISSLPELKTWHGDTILLYIKSCTSGML